MSENDSGKNDAPEVTEPDDQIVDDLNHIQIGLSSDDEGFEHNVRRWTPVATEFRMRQVGLARGMIRSARFAGRCHLLTPSWLQSLEAGALTLVRCESRPVYSSGRRGEWGDTGARWRIDSVA
jgi:hypothetical protein